MHDSSGRRLCSRTTLWRESETSGYDLDKARPPAFMPTDFCILCPAEMKAWRLFDYDQKNKLTKAPDEARSLQSLQPAALFRETSSRVHDTWASKVMLSDPKNQRYASDA